MFDRERRDQKSGQPDKPDFEEVFDTYYDKIFRYVYSILLNKESAEDVVSDTFLTAYAAYDRYNPALASVATWLSGIAHNKAVNVVRSPAYKRCDPLPDTQNETIMAPGDFVARLTDREQLIWLYEHLSESECEFLDLRYVMELKDAEVAQLYNIPVKTVNKRYQRLLAKCRKILEKSG